jgi:hypothetical protein
MKRLIVGFTSAVAGFLITRKLTEKKEGVTWISGEGSEINEEKPEPQFDIGEEVLTVDPYTGDYIDTDFDMSPLYFEVEDYAWAYEEGIYRYKLKNNDEWFAEVWLTEPEHPMMTKNLVENEDTEPKEEKTMAKEKMGHRALERTELARRKEWSERADVLLDRYNEKLQAGDTEGADRAMQKYQREQAMFNAGSVIREVGGELGGEEPSEPMFKGMGDEEA